MKRSMVLLSSTPDRARTCDLPVNSRVLCQLSYGGFMSHLYWNGISIQTIGKDTNDEDRLIAELLKATTHLPAVGLEPTTTRLRVLRSTN